MTRQQTLTSDQYSGSASVGKSVTLRVTEAQAKEIMAALGSVSSANKAVLLLCPSDKTAPPPVDTATDTAPRPATATRP